MFVLLNISFFITIPIIKNETRLIEKKIQSHKSKIFILEKNLSEANLEFQYLSSPAVLSSKIKKNFNQEYKSLDSSQIYSNVKDFISLQKNTTSILINEK